jgi:DNA-binding LacI/PurR family transcriptional regulator
MGKSFLLGLLIRDISKHLTMDVLKGLQDVTYERDYSIITYYHGDSAADEAHHLRMSLARKVDGLIVVPAIDADGKTNAESFARLRRDGLPVVQILTQAFEDVPCIRIDHEAAGRMATAHLLQLGHRRIIHLTIADYRDLKQPGTQPIAREVWRGYESAMRSAGLAPRIICAAMEAPFEGLTELAGRWRGMDERPTALVALFATGALRLMNHLAEAGIAIPRELSIISCSDIQAADFSRPPLTALGQPLVRIGQAAAQCLFDQMAGGPGKGRLFVPELIPRGSTQAPDRISPT